MLTFEEFAKKVEYLPLEQQKECYKWYIEGCKQGWEDNHKDSEWKQNNFVSDDDGWYRMKAEEFLKEIENGKTEKN